MVAVVAFAAAPAARAEFDIQITASTIGTLDINVGDPLNTSGSATVIQVDTGTLNNALALAGAGFRFSNLSADITPIGGIASQLSVTGLVASLGFTGPITISASAIGYTIPGPGPASLSSTATANGAGAGFGGQTFNSYLDTANMQFATSGPTVTASSPLVFAAVTGGQGKSAPDSAVLLTGPFSLTNSTTVTFSGLGADQFTGTTLVRSVPEPASMALVLMGGSALVAGLRRRKVTA
jgi:hypothetical protein